MSVPRLAAAVPRWVAFTESPCDRIVKLSVWPSLMPIVTGLWFGYLP